MYFPSLILQEICGYCDHRTWVATCSVSREWREASLHHRFKRLEVASDTAISHLSHLFPHVLSLSLYNISSYGLRRIAEVLKRDCHVQSLSLVRCHASGKFNPIFHSL
jgi:peptide methionine sulfoxide reductase MsrB